MRFGWLSLGWLGWAAGRRCGTHGNFSVATGHCQCDPGWATAVATNTLAYFEGSCTQYPCQSDQWCQQQTGFPDATCPVRGWSCDCGWDHAGEPRCLSWLYTFSINMTEGIRGAIPWWWRGVAVVAAVLLPFGQVRTRCPHQTGWWSHACQGQCTLRYPWRQTGWRDRWEDVRDELAWSVWVVQVGIWGYLSLMGWYLVFLTCWSYVMWLVVGLLVIGTVVVGWIRGRRTDPLDPPVASYQTALFWDPGHQTGMATQCCDDGSSESGCCCLEVCCCAGWWRWLVKTFPAYPHNRAGGLVGYWVGTHPNRLTYQGDRCGVDRLLGLRAYRDLRHDLTLMTAVQSSLAELRLPSDPDSLPPVVGVQVWWEPDLSWSSQQLVSGSYDDYRNNQCPICGESEVPRRWTRFSCGHAVCERCGDQILRYCHPVTGERVGFPCFACRQVSRTATVRGPYQMFPPIRVRSHSDWDL